MKSKIKILDTTLRDGEQAPGFSMNIKEKIEVAKQLEKLGVDIIEAGFAKSSKEDFEAIKEISKIVKDATIGTLARANKDDIDCAWEAVKKAQKSRIKVFIATSDIHMKYKLHMSKEEVLKRVEESIKYAKKYCDNIQFSAEDATRSDPEFLHKVLEKAIESGASTIGIPDTVGYIMPEELYNLITNIKNNVKNIENIDIAVHCHNDLGMATANTLAGIKAGATQIDCTINGIGERAGNTALEEIVMLLKTRSDLYGFTTNINSKEIFNTSKLITNITEIEVQPNKPVVGRNAFLHESRNTSASVYYLIEIHMR